MKDNSKLTAIILVIVTIIVVVVSSVLGRKENQKDEKELNIVTNYSNFYTVNSCLYRVITYLGSEDRNSVMKILDENYKNKNKIKENEVLDLFPKVEQGSTFVSTKMYYQTFSKNIIKYYVKGYIQKNELVELQNLNKFEQSDEYFIVYLDFENKIFSIEPYSGDIFMDGELNEK